MKKGSLTLAASIIAILVIGATLSRFFVDLLWFGALGFRAVFMTTWLTELTVFVVATGFSCAILLLNGLMAARTTSTERADLDSGLLVVVGKGYPRSLSFPWTSCRCGLSFRRSLCCSACSSASHRLAAGRPCSSGSMPPLSDDPILYLDMTWGFMFFRFPFIT